MMSNEIVNKVEQSGLIQIDLAKFNPMCEIIDLDLKKYLFNNLVLREKDFRKQLEEEDWTNFANKAVFIHCSEEVIMPSWAYMLIYTKLHNIATLAIKGNEIEIQKILIMLEIDKLNFSDYKDKKVILKGCSKLPEAEFALTYLTSKLQPFVSSLMFGEPCSTVPIFKRKK